MLSRYVLLVLAASLSLFCPAGEAGSDMAAQFARVQAQLKDLSQKLEVQQNKIDEQDRTIAVLKGENAPLGDSPILKNLDAPDKPPGNGALYELPPVNVSGEGRRPSPRAEPTAGDRVGIYQQPQWTAQRRFLETRAYVIPEGDFEFEYWNVMERPRKDHGPTTTEEKYEVEMGLGHHFQLDIYGLSHSIGNGKYFAFDEHDIELRYAFADWDKIPGNPTAYAEYKFLNGQPDHAEFKALFAGEAGCGPKKWEWAANLVYEHALGQMGDSSYEITGGAAYPLVDRRFSVGAETKCAFLDDHNSRLRFGAPEFTLGPSFQVTPLEKLHIDFTPLVGVNKNSPEFKTLLVVGWKF